MAKQRGVNIVKKIMTFFILSLCLLAPKIFAKFTPEDNLAPCDFSSTINITDGIKQRNGSIFHNNVQYLETQYADYNYIKFNISERTKVPKHTRGCLCVVKDCIRVCCPFGQAIQNGTCVDHEVHNVFFNSTIESDLGDNKTFGVIYGKPCKRLMKLTPEIEPFDEWTLLQVSSIRLNSFFAPVKFA